MACQHLSKEKFRAPSTRAPKREDLELLERLIDSGPNAAVAVALAVDNHDGEWSFARLMGCCSGRRFYPTTMNCRSKYPKNCGLDTVSGCFRRRLQVRFASKDPAVDIAVNGVTLIPLVDVYRRTYLPSGAIQRFDQVAHEHPRLHRFRPHCSPRVAQHLVLRHAVAEAFALQTTMP